jgi:hypothetical protein
MVATLMSLFQQQAHNDDVGYLDRGLRDPPDASRSFGK